MTEKIRAVDLQGVITKEELKELIAEAIQDHACVLNSETVAVLNDPDNREVIRTIAKGLTPNSAAMLARVGRMIDQVEFSLGTLLLRSMVFGTIAFVIWLAFEKSGFHLEHQ
jgi:hypothetical protein